jgi:hypothetical protein
MGRVSHGSPVERAPNSSITAGRVYPDPVASGSYSMNTFSPSIESSAANPCSDNALVITGTT